MTLTTVSRNMAGHAQINCQTYFRDVALSRVGDHLGRYVDGCRPGRLPFIPMHPQVAATTSDHTERHSAERRRENPHCRGYFEPTAPDSRFGLDGRDGDENIAKH